MDRRPDDEMLLLAAAERDIGALCALYERHAGDCRSDMASGQTGERPVILVQRPPAVEPGYQEPARPRSGGLPEGHHHSPRRRRPAW
jgi:hypothetical protein